MKNIHVLPTDKSSRLWINNLLQGKLELSEESLLYNTAQNIYITSDEDINENDYVITKDGRLVEVSYLLSKDLQGASKIILTTDQELIKDGIQAIDDEFLEWFVKNPSCEVVETFIFGFDDSIISHSKKYEIIIPKEEPKQETLEEAAERLYPNGCDGTDRSAEIYRRIFIEGAKWQQERSYSEEDMIKFAEFVASYPDKNRNVDSKLLHAKSKYDGAETTIDLFQQFKKK